MVIVTLEWPVAGDMPFTLNTGGQEPQVYSETRVYYLRS